MKRLIAIVGAAVALTVGAAAAPRAGTPTLPNGHVHETTGGAARVVVQAVDATAAGRAVEAAGGEVTAVLPIVDGVAATLPRAHLDEVRARPGVRAVTPDDPVVFSEVAGGGSGGPDPVSVYRKAVEVEALLAAGIDGEHVTVALVDTGIARVDDLADRVVAVPDPNPATTPAYGGPYPMVACADFSGATPFGEAPACTDGYGHGTFMAGLIAGDGTASGGRYQGVAPEVRLADIKIAGDDGAADVSKVLAAIQYIVSFKDVIDPPVRVINLSLGTTSRKDYRHDPLNYAVERAWNEGLVVVVAAGNTGPAPRTISKPADDPNVITVGALDDLETTDLEDDRLPHFSARGPATFEDYGDPPQPATGPGGTPLTVAKPDVVAPGARLVSLRPVDEYGEPLETTIPDPQGWSTDDYRRGSGTSMAAAVVSGVAALYADAKVERRLPWTRVDPERFKRSLLATARPLASHEKAATGRGLVNASGAVGRALIDSNATQAPMHAAGDGPLDGSRGIATETTRACTQAERLMKLKLIGPCSIVLDGERTAQDRMWDAEGYHGAWTGDTWYGSSWYGSSWYASTWAGSSWYGSSWYGSSWYSQSDDRAYGTAVNGSSWYGAWE